MKINGRCHCGQITYQALVDPARVAICHCTDCQSLTGTAYRVSVPTRIEDFELQTGTPAVYIKTAANGAKRAQTFCGNCGSPLYTYAVDAPITYGLRVGCIEQRDALKPSRQKWCTSALSWAFDIDALPRSDRE